jgi:hypothetical protein
MPITILHQIHPNFNCPTCNNFVSYIFYFIFVYNLQFSILFSIFHFLIFNFLFYIPDN